MPKVKDYYAVLGVERRSHARVIEQSYWERAHELHNVPTRQAQKRLSALNEAYETLASPYRRAEYDRRLASDQSTRTVDGAGGLVRLLTAIFTRPFRI